MKKDRPEINFQNKLLTSKIMVDQPDRHHIDPEVLLPWRISLRTQQLSSCTLQVYRYIFNKIFLIGNESYLIFTCEDTLQLHLHSEDLWGLDRSVAGAGKTRIYWRDRRGQSRLG